MTNLDATKDKKNELYNAVTAALASGNEEQIKAAVMDLQEFNTKRARTKQFLKAEESRLLHQRKQSSGIHSSLTQRESLVFRTQLLTVFIPALWSSFQRLNTTASLKNLSRNIRFSA